MCRTIILYLDFPGHVHGVDGISVHSLEYICTVLLNLEKSVGRTHMTQALDPPSYIKKILITNKVTTDFFITLIESICYALHARPTDLSRMIRDENSN